jgi:hypothetical protein
MSRRCASLPGSDTPPDPQRGAALTLSPEKGAAYQSNKALVIR